MKVHCYECKKAGYVPDDAPGLGPNGWQSFESIARKLYVCSKRCERKFNRREVKQGRKPWLFLPTLEIPDAVPRLSTGPDSVRRRRVRETGVRPMLRKGQRATAATGSATENSTAEASPPVKDVVVVVGYVVGIEWHKKEPGSPMACMVTIAAGDQRYKIPIDENASRDLPALGPVYPEVTMVISVPTRSHR